MKAHWKLWITGLIVLAVALTLGYKLTTSHQHLKHEHHHHITKPA